MKKKMKPFEDKLRETEKSIEDEVQKYVDLHRFNDENEGPPGGSGERDNFP
jgi:hypothetical protein